MKRVPWLPLMAVLLAVPAAWGTREAWTLRREVQAAKGKARTCAAKRDAVQALVSRNVSTERRLREGLATGELDGRGLLAANAELEDRLRALQGALGTPEAQALLRTLGEEEAKRRRAVAWLASLHGQGAQPDALEAAFGKEVAPRHEAFGQQANALLEMQSQCRETFKRAAEQTGHRARVMLSLGSACGVLSLFGVLAAAFKRRRPT